MIENEGSKSKASEDRGQGQCAVAAVQRRMFTNFVGAKNPHLFPTFHPSLLKEMSRISASLFNLFSRVKLF